MPIDRLAASTLNLVSCAHDRKSETGVLGLRSSPVVGVLELELRLSERCAKEHGL